jgi:anti-anti-sigma regulatory factor
MVLVTINKSKRLLYFAYIGQVCFQEMKRAREDLPEILQQLPTNLRILADLERLESMDSASAAEIGKVMEMLDRKGVELSVRVIPDPSKDIGLSILTMFHYRKKIRVVTCQSMAEAAKELGL